MKLFTAYHRARINQFHKDLVYQTYMASCSQNMNHIFAERYSGSYMSKSYYELVMPDEKPKETGAQIRKRISQRLDEIGAL